MRFAPLSLRSFRRRGLDGSNASEVTAVFYLSNEKFKQCEINVWKCL